MQASVMESYAESELDEGMCRSGELGRRVRDNSNRTGDYSIPYPRGHSWEKTPGTKPSTLQQKHQNAALGLGEKQIGDTDVMELLQNLAAEEMMYTVDIHCVRGSAIAGTATLVGGMLGGPPGMFIGATLGGLIAWRTSESFKLVTQILMELPADEKMEICAEVKAVLKNLQWEDADNLIPVVMKNPTVKAKVKRVLINYITKKLKAQIRYGE